MDLPLWCELDNMEGFVTAQEGIWILLAMAAS